MSWIKIKRGDEIPGRLQKIYQAVAGDDQHVDNVLQIHSLRPHTLEGHLALYKAVLHHSHNQLPVWFLECIGIYVSRLNRCDYCDRHHSAGLQRLINDDDRFQALDKALSRPLPAAPFSPAEQQAFVYVRQLTIAPSENSLEHVTSLRQAGYSDGEILEINQVAAYFAYANRTVLGLGVDIAGEPLGSSPQTDTDMHSLGHR